MCRNDPLVLGIMVSREVHHKRWASFVDIMVILISIGLIVIYVVTAYNDRPTQLVDVLDYTTLTKAGLDLYSHDCQCSNETFPFRTFTKVCYATMLIC
jgi:cbb3-type cytochrome oxidase cytochrome c subunit